MSAELGKFLDKKVRVKFQGGREGSYTHMHTHTHTHAHTTHTHTATGVLKGYDQLLNLVLDGTIEHIQGEQIYLLLTLDLVTI